MKHLLLCALASLLVACANQPSCQLKCGVSPLPVAHTRPYHPAPWTSFDGAQFPYSVWPAHTRAKAVVILVPGWDSTMTDYADLAQHLSHHGYTVYGSELRAGIYDPQPARRGDPRDWQAWVRDLQVFTRFVAHREPGRPIFYHGHSFGTLLTLQTAQIAWDDHSPLAPRGIILQSLAMPFLIEKENPILSALIAAVRDVRIPHLALAEPLNGLPTGDAQLSCQWLRSQDRVSAGYTGRYFEQAAKLGHAARIAAKKPGPPTFALEGLQDNVVAPRRGQKKEYHRFLTEDLRQGHAQVTCYQNGFHTITVPQTVKSPAQRADSAQAMADITHWLDQNSRPRN